MSTKSENEESNKTVDSTVTQVGGASGPVSETADDQGRRTEVPEAETGDTAQVDAGTQAFMEDLEAIVAESEAVEEVLEEPLEGAEEESIEAEDVTPETPASSESKGSSKTEEEEAIQVLMANPVRKEVTPRIMMNRKKTEKFRLVVAVDIFRGGDGIEEKSFRLWVKKVLTMEEKEAYYLRAAGKVALALNKGGLTWEQVTTYSIAHLVLLSRFPEDAWRVGDGDVLIRDGEKELALSATTVDTLRKLLQKMKAAELSSTPTEKLRLELKSLREECVFDSELEQRVRPIRKALTPMVQQWIDEVDDKLKRKAEAIEDAEGALRDRREEKEGLDFERREAQRWLDILDASGAGLGPAQQAQKAEVAKQEAETTRQNVAESRRAIAGGRRTATPKPAGAVAQ